MRYLYQPSERVEISKASVSEEVFCSVGNSVGAYEQRLRNMARESRFRMVDGRVEEELT